MRVPRRIFKQPRLKIMVAANKDSNEDAQQAGVKMVVAVAVAVAVGDSSKNTNHI